MTEPWAPSRWANTISRILYTVLGNDRFPVDVREIAQDYSLQRFPGDPISLVQGTSLPGFDGALYRAPAGKSGWGIIYNDAIRSTGRINFTLAHEFGHYLLHREAHPDGIECGQQDMLRWDSSYAQIERQANEFSAGLLMPLDDFRKQIDAREKPTLEDIGECAHRYEVSLVAAVLRWLQYTERRSVLVVSRDGYLLWARSSKHALRTGAFLKTSGVAPISVPEKSLAEAMRLGNDLECSRDHDVGIWFPEPCEEIALVSDRYDFALSLLHLNDDIIRHDDDEETVDDASNVIARHSEGSRTDLS